MPGGFAQVECIQNPTAISVPNISTTILALMTCVVLNVSQTIPQLRCAILLSDRCIKLFLRFNVSFPDYESRSSQKSN